MIQQLFDRISAELGVEVTLVPPPASLAGIPVALHDLYGVTDGVSLPFADLVPSARLSPDPDPPFGSEWIDFGWDGYFTRYYVAVDPRVAEPIALFDVDEDAHPEGMYTSVEELLEEQYRDHVENDLHVAELHVVHVPATARLPQVIAELKRVAALPSAELLARLRSGPFRIDSVNSATGIVAIRALHDLGVTACLKNVEPGPGGRQR